MLPYRSDTQKADILLLHYGTEIEYKIKLHKKCKHYLTLTMSNTHNEYHCVFSTEEVEKMFQVH